MQLTIHEQQWLEDQRRLRRQVFVGLDHHTTQLTVACADGELLLQGPAPASLPIARFAQDGAGYQALLALLRARFPDTSPADFAFLSEPTYAKPLCHFLVQAGFAATQVYWVRTTKVGQYRKAHDLSRAGKNDDEDARTMLWLLFDGLTEPSRRHLFFPATWQAPGHALLQHLSAEYDRLNLQLRQLEGKIFQLVQLLFPELRQVYTRQKVVAKPDGTTFHAATLALFTSTAPLLLLSHYPSPRALHAAGFDRVWATIGRVGLAKAKLRQVIALAATSAGLPDDLAAHRLALLIEEYQALQQRKQRYRRHMRDVVEQDPVLRSFLAVVGVTEVVIAGLVGAMGDLTRVHDADQVKSYMGLAPKPMPQTGKVDDEGRVVQVWRMPAHTYAVQHGQRQRVYTSPGQSAPRRISWLWFGVLMKQQRHHAADPFVQLYQHLKARHQGTRRWVGRVRWKVVAKLVTTIFTCLKHQQPYDPARVRLSGGEPAQAASR